MKRRQRHWSSYTAETKIRPAVLRRDNYECQLRYPGICLGSAKTVDHIHPKLWGGLDNMENLRAACKPCNQFKGTKTDEQVAVLLRERSASGSPFFSGASDRRAPLRKISPASRWGVIRSDYSRKDTNDGGSAA